MQKSVSCQRDGISNQSIITPLPSTSYSGIVSAKTGVSSDPTLLNNLAYVDCCAPPQRRVHLTSLCPPSTHKWLYSDGRLVVNTDHYSENDLAVLASFAKKAGGLKSIHVSFGEASAAAESRGMCRPFCWEGGQSWCLQPRLTPAATPSFQTQGLPSRSRWTCCEEQERPLSAVLHHYCHDELLGRPRVSPDDWAATQP